jgi:formylglycine-generating enzyme required for sulfatase activity
MSVTSIRSGPGAARLGVLFLVGAITSSQAISPAISIINITSNGPQLVITSDVGATNQIQSASELSQPTWEVLTNLVVTKSPYLFVDLITPLGPQRYYRIVAFSGTNSQNAPVNMALIPAGTFEMGDSFNEGASYELPVHEVYVSGFYMDKYEVTKALWDQVVASNSGNGYAYDNPGSGKGPNHPVQSINWYDMVKWCNARSEMEGRAPAYYTDPGLTQIYKTGQVAPYVNWNAGYRLPTEAEWEKADRGGASGHRFPWSDVDTISHSQANYYSDPSYSYDVSPTRGFNPAFNDGTMPYTSPVGSFAPNGYGLYDTAGNVWEWCWDWAGNYSSDLQTDPHGPETGSTRVGRGGNWNFYAEHCRAAYRYGNSPDYTATNIGFRCALPAP